MAVNSQKKGNIPNFILLRSIFYAFLRIIVRISVSVFFRHITVIGRDKLRHIQGPVIVVVNHPSTLMDVLMPGTFIPRVMFFLANYSLFKNPISNWVLTNTYGIPVKRKEDVSEGESRDNDKAFEESYETLEKGRVLFVAPEGVSWMNRFVRPLKTGTARIALATEARNEGKLGVRIVPIGLTYNAPNIFRSNAVVHIGEPVLAAQWLDEWKKMPKKAADQLTDKLEKTLQELTIHTVDEAGERVFNRLETLLHNETPLTPLQEFERSQAIIRAGTIAPGAFRDRVNAYFDQLEAAGVQDWAVRHTVSLGEILLLILGFPVFLTSMVFWFLPCYIPGLLAKKLNLYIGYTSTVKVLTGMVLTFPLALWATWHFTGVQGWASVGLIAVLIVLGLFAERYLDAWGHFRESRQRKHLSPGALQAFQDERKSILAAIG